MKTLGSKMSPVSLTCLEQKSLSSDSVLGSAAGEGWISGGGFGKLQEAPTRLPLH